MLLEKFILHIGIHLFKLVEFKKKQQQQQKTEADCSVQKVQNANLTLSMRGKKFSRRYFETCFLS